MHGEDIRRPLGIARDYPLPEVARALRFYSGSDTIIGGKTRMSGLMFKASDTDLSIGDGPLVEGPLISLLLASTGRQVALDDLTGDGVELLRSRS